MKIGIVGLGLIGGSLGLDFRGLGHEVLGLGRRSETCVLAEELGAVDAASAQPQILQACEVIFLCAPLGQLLAVAEQIKPFLKSDAILTDVGSVKGTIVEPLTASWPRFVGGHPMAGTAETGITAAQKNLFCQRPYVLTPIAATDTAAVNQLAELVDALGAVRYTCTPADHDRAVAWISHLPVMVSAALIGACGQESNTELTQLAQALASSGFRDTSRVGGGNPELGRMMAEFNTAELLHCLKTYETELSTVIQTIEQGNWAGLEAYLAQTQATRSLFPNI